MTYFNHNGHQADVVCCLAKDWKHNWFAVEHLEVQRLLLDWRWLCPKPVTLVARNAFADLFLRDDSGEIYLLDVAVGKITQIADSEAQFRELAATHEKREEWFAEADELSAFARGLQPDTTQCIGFSTPLVFAESGYADNPYVADLYEHVFISWRPKSSDRRPARGSKSAPARQVLNPLVLFTVDESSLRSKAPAKG